MNWKVYHAPEVWNYGDALAWFVQFMNAAPGNPLYDRGMATVSDVAGALAADVTNDSLPQVSWIIPQDGYSLEHEPWSATLGEYFVSRVVAALAANPAVYNSTVFILNYDEEGGYFDHVPPPAPPPGTAGEFAGNTQLGLGTRVPMIIISPWTRGGRVCSQVFDHTSVIRFLETWTGVQETNLTAWRRQVCGDLTSAFDFAHPDFSLPTLPPPRSQIGTRASKYPRLRSNPSRSRNRSPPRLPAALPAGRQWSRRLRQQPPVRDDDQCRRRLHGFCDLPQCRALRWALAVRCSVRKVSDGFLCSAGQCQWLLRLHLLRSQWFSASVRRQPAEECNQIEIASLINPTAGGVSLSLLNSSLRAVDFTVTDNLNSGALWNAALPPASATNQVFLAVANNNGWYDLTVTADAVHKFLLRHLAGHSKPGRFPSPRFQL